MGRRFFIDSFPWKTVYQNPNGIAIPISSLSSNWSDPVADPVVLNSVNGASTNGIAVTFDSHFIFYAGGSGGDAIFYSVADVRINPPAIYRMDDTPTRHYGRNRHTASAGYRPFGLAIHQFYF